MSTEPSFMPLRLIIPWPHDKYPFPTTTNDKPSFLDNVGISSFQFNETTEGMEVDIEIAVLKETSFNILGLEGFDIVFGENDDNNSITRFHCKLLLSETVRFTLHDLSLGLRFPTSWFKPMRKENNVFIENRDDQGKLLPYQIDIKNIDISIDGTGNIDLKFKDGAPSIKLAPFMIGDTGIILEAESIIFCFSQESVKGLPSSVSVPADWRGIYLNDVKVYLPKEISVDLPTVKEAIDPDLKITDFLIGAGGISGRINGKWTPKLSTDGKSFTGHGAGNLFGIPFALQEIAIEIKQNALTSGLIKGPMIFPFFDQPAFVDIGLSTNGDFAINLSADQSLLSSFPPENPLPLNRKSDGLFVFKKENLMELIVKGLGFEHKDNNFMININGSIIPLVRGLKWPEFEVRSLSIDSHGRVKLDGGWIDLPKQKSFDLYGFSVNITKLGFGNEEDGTKWIALSGGIKLVDGLPLEGGVEGLKIKWKPPTNIKMEIGGVRVAFEIKDTLKFDGSVIFIDEPDRKGFKGGVKMVLYPLDGCSLDVQLMVGKNSRIPPYTFFYTYVEADLPIGIPLFSTGLSLYGMAGLFGYNMETSKGKAGNPENETWYEGFYLRPVPGITDALTKWHDNFESRAFGAGITLGTTPDNGFSFSAKTLIVLLIPGPVIIVEGKANFLKERKELDENEPLFRLLAIYDGRAGTFLMNIEANYALPQGSGKVLNIHALAEAFFDFNNARNWHLYIGQDEPVEKRIRAKILSLFEANAYFMLTSKHLAMGAWVGYDNRWRFGPLSIELSAWMEGRVEITFKPAQADGSLALQGSVQLKAFSVSLGLSVAAGVQVQTPSPFLVRAEFSVKLDLPRPLPRPKAHIVLEWKTEEKPPIPVPLAKFGLEHLKVTEKWTLDIYPKYDIHADGFYYDDSNILHLTNSEDVAAIQNSPIIPLDARPVIVFAKPVEDAARIGDNPMPAPLPEIVGEGYQYRYRLLEVRLEMRPKNQNSGGGWTSVQLYGKWQSVLENGQQVNTKLMLWTNSAFEISRELSNNDIFTGPILETYNPCNFDITPTQTCVDFEEQKAGTVLPPVSIHDDITLYGQSGELTVVEYDAQPFNATKALLLEGGGRQRFYIVFSKPVAKVDLSLGKETSVSVYAFEEDSKGLQPEQSSSSYEYSYDSMKQVSIEGKGITALLISGRGLLAKICYVTAEEMKRVNDNITLQTHIKESIAVHWNQHNEILFEPNTCYKLTAVSEGVRNNESVRFEQYSYFQTEGAPGVYPKAIAGSSSNTGASEGTSDHFPTGGPLKDLSAYVKDTIPRVGQKPVYRGYDIGAIFNESYVDQMYSKYLMGDMSLSIELYDNNDEPVLDTDGKPISIQNQWGDNPQTFLTREEQQWIRLLNMNDCGGFLNYQNKSKTKNLYAGHKRLNLKPETLYKAKIVAVSSDNTPPPPPNVVYQFSFITSKYSSFTHQIQSFQDVLWSHIRLLSSNTPLSLITGANKPILEGILSSVSSGNSYQADTEDKQFHQISELFGLGIRQLPASFEMLALDANELAAINVNPDVDAVELATTRDDDAWLVPITSRCYGFLIESPEPIDWNRTVLMAKFKPVTTTTTGIPLVQEATEAIKILDASIISSSSGGPGTNYNNEWADILLRDDFDISDFSIEHISAGSNNSQKFMTFGKESKRFPAGTIIRVHTGKKQDDADPSADIEHRYAKLDSWQFSPAGETIKVLDKNGTILHSRYIEPQGSFSSKDIILIRNADNTRAFLFFPSEEEKAGKVDNGNYRLDFKYKLNIGNNQPVLKRMGGIDSDEDTTVEFSYPAILP